MFGALPNRAAAYARVGVETGVSTASPHQLIVMLFDGALMSISLAAIAMEQNDIPTKGSAISKSIDIINNGLKASLDMEAGGSLSERLAALYDYMTERLLYANLKSNRAALDEVATLLGGLREAWIGIAPEGQTAAA